MTSPPRPTTVPTLAGLTVLFAVAFGVLTHNVVDRSGLTVIDPEVSGWAVTQRNAVLTPLAHFLSAIGGTLPMTVVATAVTLLLYRAGDRAHATLVAVAGLGAALIVFGGKRIIGRERPPVVDRLAVENSLAYPSGHSVGTFVVIGIVAVVLIPRLTGTLARIATGTAAALFVVAVGCSRVYLGVHWPTDVLGAWCVSAAWILFCLTVFHYRREVPDEPGSDADAVGGIEPRTIPGGNS